MGRKLNHTCSQIVVVSRTLSDFKNPKYNSNAENSGEAQYLGQKIKFKQEKSKVGGRKGATASVNFYYDYGLDTLQNAIDLSRMYGIVDGTTWLSLIDPPTGEVVFKAQGGNNFKKELAENNELYAKFDYLLTYTQRGMEVKSVVDEWDEIKQEVFGGDPFATEEQEEETNEDQD